VTAPVSEPKGRGAAWTEERGTSDEGRQRPRAARRRASGGTERAGGGTERAGEQHILERRYRRLLALYPAEHRREHADEMIGVLLASASDTGTGHAADMADLVAGAFRIRSRNAARRLRRPGTLRGAVRDRRWGDALAVVSVVAPLLLLVAALAQFNLPQAVASTASGHPYWPLSGPFSVPDWALTIGAPLVVLLAFGRLRRLGGLAALATAIGLLPAQSITSPALAFSVLLAVTAAAGLLLSRGAEHGFALIRWWGAALIGSVAILLGGFSLGGFSLSGYLASTGTYAPAVPGSYTNYAVLPPAEVTGLAGDLVIAGVVVVVALGCLLTPVGRRVLALFAIAMVPYAYIWADKLSTDLIWQRGGITSISTSAVMLYLPPALVACVIVVGTRLSRRRADTIAATG
jgi:hypothetical protein